ncbi:glycoside hydrolase family 32 protein [Bacillus gobiensis]|uniref:GH32 C-terminal domain-containing protein n=1 Tax=Bacillus gobiensis TaxID=1441095 RepID=UPI003D22330D
MIQTKFADAKDGTQYADYGYFDETYRPQVHYTAEKNMINDPNGLVYYDGEYHLSHQYNLFGAVHWGHAVSTDLVHWKHLQPTIMPDEIGQIWSGSAVVDEKNTSGLQTGDEKVIVALFTYSEHNKGTQSQGLAYSNDRGRTYKMYSGNPVIPNPGIEDFRDPKVFWHEESGKWVMVLVAGDHVKFYTSKDLITWKFASNFGKGEGGHGGKWETPDLFEVPVDGNPNKTKWVLSIGVMGGSPSGGTAMQYIVGDFDGKTFTNDNPSSTVLWQNYGKDFYAAQTWHDIPASDGRRLMIAWADNWQYRFDPPTTPFNGQLTLVRELQLKTFPEGIRLIQTPVKEYETLRKEPQQLGRQALSPNQNVLSGISGDNVEIVAEFTVDDSTTASEFGFKVRKGPTQETVVGYDVNSEKIFVDRTKSGLNPNINWPGKHSAPLKPDKKKIKMRIFVDRSSVEVFANDGKRSLSELILPDRSSTGLETYSVGGKVTLDSLTVYPLKKAYSDTSPFQSTNLSGWTTIRGEWADTLYGKEGSADEDGIIMSAQQGSDFTYEGEITVKGVEPGNPEPIKGEAAGSLVFRADKTLRQGYAIKLDASTNKVTLVRFNPDYSTTILDQYNTAIDTNTPYDLKVKAIGDSIKVYLNDTEVINSNDSAYSDGYFGLHIRDAVSYFNKVYYSNTTNFKTNLNGWNIVQGTWKKTLEGMKGNSSGDAIQIARQTASDFTYEADVKINQDTNGAAALVFRSNDDASEAYAVNVDAWNDRVTLFKFGNGGGNIAVHSTEIDPGKWYHVRVEALGSNIKVYLEDQEVINAVDTTYREGKLGMLVWNGEAAIQNVYYASTLNNWHKFGGSWSVGEDTITGEASGDGFYMSDKMGTNFIYQSDVSVLADQGGKAAAALVFRANEDASKGYVANVDALNDCVTLFKFNGDGTATVIDRYKYSIDANRKYGLRVEAFGARIQVFLDQKRVIDAYDSSYASGRFGLNTWNSRSQFQQVQIFP